MIESQTWADNRHAAAQARVQNDRRSATQFALLILRVVELGSSILAAVPVLFAYLISLTSPPESALEHGDCANAFLLFMKC